MLRWKSSRVTAASFGTGWRGGWRTATKAARGFEAVTRTSPAGSNNARQRRCGAVVRRRAQIAVEQHVAAHSEHPIGRTVAVLERGWCGEPDRRASVTDQEGRDCQVQAIDQASLKKERHRDAAALDEQAMMSTRVKRADEGDQVDAILRHADAEH